MSYNELKIDRKDHSLLRSLFNDVEQLPTGHPLVQAHTFKERLSACLSAVKDDTSTYYFTTENAWDDNKFRMWSSKFDPSTGDYGVNDVQQITIETLGTELPPMYGDVWTTVEPFDSLLGRKRLKLDLRAQEGNNFMAARAKFWIARVIVALTKWGIINLYDGIKPPKDLNPTNIVYGHTFDFIDWLVEDDKDIVRKAKVHIAEIWFDMVTKVGGISEGPDLEIADPDLERVPGLDDREVDEQCL